MAFTPPPFDRDFSKSVDAARRDRMRADRQKPLIGAGLFASVVRLLRGKRS